MTHLAALAVERGCGRFEWSVLDWNAPAIGFYRAIGAVGQDGWTVQRLERSSQPAVPLDARCCAMGATYGSMQGGGDADRRS